MAKISSNATVNLLSNQDEKLSTIQQKIREQAKLEIFNTLLLDKKNFVDIETTISKLKSVKSDDKIKYNKSSSATFDQLISKDVYKKIYESYNNSDDKEKMYMKIAERIILDTGGVISYKEDQEKGITKDFVEGEYKYLNEDKKYHNKLDFFTVKDPDGKLYIIKRKEEDKEAISKREDELMKEELEGKDKEIEELKKKLDAPDVEKINNKPSAEENEKNNNKDKYLTKEDLDERFDNKLKYALLDKDYKKENSERKESNRESVEKNPLYVSRKDVEKSVLASRKDSEFPVGNIEIKGTYVKVEEFQFYEEIKQEYILAKGDSVKLAELDKKLAELIILSSPRGVDTEKRYQIQLTEEEIVAGGLVVSQAFLAKYGLAVDFFEYTNTIIEREYQEKMETIREIETEITELTTIITELTRKITIEDSSSESIILEISKKREKVKILKDKMYALLISLRKNRNGGNEKPDEDLLALKEKEKQIQKELEELKKKKEHQDEVNKRIKELKEKMFDKTSWNELRGLSSERISKKQSLRNAEAKERDLAKAEEKTLKSLEPLASDYAPEEISKLTSEYYDIKKQHEDKKKDIEEIKSKLDEINQKIESNSSYKKWQEIESILDAITEGKNESIYLITKDGEKCYLQKNGDFFHVMQNPTKLFDNISSVNKEELLIALDPDYITKIIIGEKNINETEILLGNSKEDEEELARLQQEQAGFDKDIDKKIADKEKELADVRKQIEEKESKNKKKIGLGEFEVGADGDLFAGYCRDNGITREDGTEIKSGADINTSAVYLKDGKRLKLEHRKGGAFGYDDGVRTPYEFVYYEESEPAGTDDLEEQLLIIIREQGELEAELEELEIKLKKEKSESIRIIIEEEIEKIQKKLLVIKQSIVNITNSTRKYKETITQNRYRVYKVRPIPIPDWKESFEMTAVLSDMGTDVFREKASLKVEEDLKAYYKSLGRWQVGSRLALFLGRGRRRKRMIRNEMNNMANTAFQTGAGYGTLNEQSQNAADRHGHELATGMEAINKITTVHNQQVDQLCKDYLNNIINDSQFQQQFNQIIANDANVQNALNGQSITHIGTNILLRLQEQKALNQLILDMDAQLAQYVATGNVVHMDNMRNYVSQFIKDYQKTPAFMANFEQFVKGDLNARNQLRQYLNHQRAVMQMQITNLRMNIDILNKGKSAYQIDNKDRETGKGSWKFKLGHFMDKHPRGTAIASTAISVGIGLGTGLIASPVVAGALSLGLFGGLVGTTNAVKKWTHHTKEQNTHEKNVATDYRNEQAKIQAWQNQALNGHGWRKYKAKRQLALYDQTTQENIKLSDQITEYITNLSSKVGPLTADENNFMRCNLIEGWARLKYYRQMGHNFLASEQVDKTEKDMKRLEKAITLGLQKIGKTTNDIETNMNATNQLGTNITYAVIQNDLKASYDKSLIQFKRERRNLSLKYGFGTAIASIGVGAFFQWITHSGMWAGHDVPPTPGTPGTPEATTTYSSGTDNFALGEYDIDHGHIYSSTKTALSNPSVPDGSHAVIHYGVGTDIVPVRAGHLDAAELQTQLDTVRDNINAMSWGGRTAQRDAFLGELNRLRYNGFTNDNLATMRAAEELEHYAQGWADSGKNVIIDGFNRGFDASGTTYDSLAERFMKGAIDITTPEIPAIPGDPGRKAVRRGRWFMGMPLFFNTFKDRKDTTDTTDQNWGRGRGQQPNQPQVNPNQPQANPNPQQHP